MSVLYNR